MKRRKRRYSFSVALVWIEHEFLPTAVIIGVIYLFSDFIFCRLAYAVASHFMELPNPFLILQLCSILLLLPAIFFLGRESFKSLKDLRKAMRMRSKRLLRFIPKTSAAQWVRRERLEWYSLWLQKHHSFDFRGVIRKRIEKIVFVGVVSSEQPLAA